MADYNPPEIMLLQVCPCQSFAGITGWNSNKGIHTEVHGKSPRDGRAS